MKILYVIESLGSGGKERRLIELLKVITQNPNYETQLIILSDKIDYKYINNLNIKIHILGRNFFKDKNIFAKYISIINNFKPDVTHFWDNIAILNLGIVNKLYKTPLINSFISTAPPNLSFFEKQFLLTYLTFPLSDFILTNSFAGFHYYKVPIKKGKVIYNGIDFRRFDNLTSKEIIRKKFNIKTKYVIGMVASFSHYKDYKTFNEVALKISRLRPDVTFIGIGDGSDRKDFISYNNNFPDLKDRILYPGKMTDVENIINVFDIAILLSTKGEGLSNAIMEYMFLKKPVIASKAGGNKELVIDNKTGFLIQNNNKDKIIEKIILLLNNNQIAKEIGIRGHNRIKKYFNLKKMVNEYEKIYQKMRKEQ